MGLQRPMPMSTTMLIMMGITVRFMAAIGAPATTSIIGIRAINITIMTLADISAEVAEPASTQSGDMLQSQAVVAVADYIDKYHDCWFRLSRR